MTEERFAVSKQVIFRASRALPERPNLEHLRKEAKQRLKRLRSSAPTTRLAAVQRDVARDYGFASWRSLVSQFRPPVARVADRPQEHWWTLHRVRAAAEESGDWSSVEQFYRDTIASDPADRNRLEADFAIFLTRFPEKQGEADRIFDRLMLRPTPEICALHAHFSRIAGAADTDREEAILRRAVALGDDPAAFNHYANFLWRRRDDRAEAERWFRRAAELDTGDAWMDGAMRGIYATVLWKWGDAVSAETWFRLALARSRMDLQTLLAFAAMLTATGRVREGLDLVSEILIHPRLGIAPQRVACATELMAWFLRYAHDAEAVRERALAEIRTRYERWRPHEGPTVMELDRNARAAEAAGHPAASLVFALANALTPEEGAAVEAANALEQHPGWSA